MCKKVNKFIIAYEWLEIKTKHNWRSGKNTINNKHFWRQNTIKKSHFKRILCFCPQITSFLPRKLFHIVFFSKIFISSICSEKNVVLLFLPVHMTFMFLQTFSDKNIAHLSLGSRIAYALYISCVHGGYSGSKW